jgi:hypothetical protein
MFLNKDIDHVSVLIHGTPEIIPPPLDVHEEFIQVPDVSQPSLPSPELSGVVWARPLAPLPEGLVGDHHASLGKEFLYAPEAQAEAVVEPNSVTDDLRGESVSAVAASIGFHPPSLLSTASS